MTTRLSPIGLPLGYPDDATINLVGAAALAQAGTATASGSTSVTLGTAAALAQTGDVTAEAGGNTQAFPTGAVGLAQAGLVIQRGPTKLSPIGLPLLGYTASFQGSSVSIVGAVGLAEPGNVTVTLPVTGAVSQLGPLILPGPIRNIVPIVGGATVNLVGAQANAQAEEMEGCDAIVRIDGATAFANSGALIGKAQQITEPATFTPVIIERANFNPTITARLSSRLSIQVRGKFPTG